MRLLVNLLAGHKRGRRCRNCRDRIPARVRFDQRTTRGYEIGLCNSDRCWRWHCERKAWIDDYWEAREYDHARACLRCGARRTVASLKADSAEARFCNERCEAAYFGPGSDWSSALASTEQGGRRVRPHAVDDDRESGWPWMRKAGALHWTTARWSYAPERRWPRVGWAPRLLWWTEDYLRRARGGRVGHLAEVDSGHAQLRRRAR